MYFNRETDYSIRIIYCLAKSNRRIGAAEIAAQTDVSQRFSLKILLKLVNEGFVKSFKGVGGGYELTRPASEITMLDVVEAIDGPVGISQCLHNDSKCERSECCYFHRIFDGISKEITEKLKSVTFQDVVDNEKE